MEKFCIEHKIENEWTMETLFSTIKGFFLFFLTEFANSFDLVFTNRKKKKKSESFHGGKLPD